MNILKNFSLQDISYQLTPGLQPPHNTPNDKLNQDEPFNFNTNIHILWPHDQIYYSHSTLEGLIKNNDYSQHRLVQPLKHLSKRRPFKVISQQQTQLDETKQLSGVKDLLVFQKRREMLQTTNWLMQVSQQQDEVGEFLKNLRFKLNQLAASNYQRISSQILELIQPQKEQVQLIVLQIIEKAASQNKYRDLYSQLCDLLTDKLPGFQKALDRELYQIIKCEPDYESIEQQVSQLSKDDQITFLTKRKLNYIGAIKFATQLYKDYVLELDFINASIINLINQYLKYYKQSSISSQFKEEALEGLIELITKMKNNLFTKQSKDDQSLENKFIDFLKSIKSQTNKQWKQKNMNFSKYGIRNILITLQNKEISQRLSILIETLLMKIDSNWSAKPQKLSVVDSSDSERDEPSMVPLSKQNSSQSQNQKNLKLTIPKLDQINEEEIEYSVTKQPTLIQLVQQMEKIFKFPSSEEFKNEIFNLYKIIKLPELYIGFWSCLLKNILRLTKDNLEKVKILQQLYNLSNEDEILRSQILDLIISNVFELMYDAIDSPYGQEFMKNCLQNFLKQDITILDKWELENYSDIQEFIMKLLPNILEYEDLQNQQKLEVINNFIENKLKLDINQQQIFWKSIK